MTNHTDQTATDRTALRELITNALATHDCAKIGVDVPDRDHDFWDIWQDSADAVLAVLPAARAAVLSDVERRVLASALDLAEEEMLARGDDEDELEAVKNLRRLADAPAAAVSGRTADETPHRCRNCEGINPDTCLMNPDRPKPQPMDPVHILGIGADDAPAVGGAQQACGRTTSFDGTVYPPCTRRPGHWNAYCRSGDGSQFLTVDPRQPKETRP